MNTPLVLIGPYTAFGLAFGTFLMKGFFGTLPRELEFLFALTFITEESNAGALPGVPAPVHRRPHRRRGPVLSSGYRVPVPYSRPSAASAA